MEITFDGLCENIEFSVRLYVYTFVSSELTNVSLFLMEHNELCVYLINNYSLRDIFMTSN